MKVLAVIPIYNEKVHAGWILDRFPFQLCDLVMVDDCSTDGTYEEIVRRNVPVIRHTARSGVGKSIQDGIARALENNYDAVLVMAGNGKDNPQEISHLLSSLETADYVQGSRFMSGGESKNLPWGRWLAIRSLSLIWSICTLHWLTDVTNGFRVYRTTFLRLPDVHWDQDWLSSYDFETYIHYKALQLKVRFREIAVTKNYPTRTGYSKMRPGQDWYRLVRPLFLLMFRIRQ